MDGSQKNSAIETSPITDAKGKQQHTSDDISTVERHHQALNNSVTVGQSQENLKTGNKGVLITEDPLMPDASPSGHLVTATGNAVGSFNSQQQQPGDKIIQQKMGNGRDSAALVEMIDSETPTANNHHLRNRSSLSHLTTVN